MTRIKFFLASLTVATAIFAGMARFAFSATTSEAGTLIPGGTVYEDVVWTKEGSPYRIKGHYKVSGHSLTIGPGVTVTLAEDHDVGTRIYVSDGDFIVNGNEKERVLIENIGRTDAYRGRTYINNADFRNQGAMYFYHSSTTISNSTFASTSEWGLVSWDSDVSISSSTIAKNKGGVMVAKSIDAITDSKLSIHNSRIIDNIDTAVQNMQWSLSDISAENNWWGSPEGPNTSTSSRIIGKASYAPWLTSDPMTATAGPSCCSNVLFIPGLQGTRLYAPETWPLNIVTDVGRLWEPSNNADVRQLYLDSAGKSIDQSIYSGEPVGMAYGLKGIYGNFMKYLDSLTQDNTIREWRYFGYDWRKPVSEVVESTEKKASTTESLISVVEDLSSRSPTGKVSIIAHSNGGLVAKYLVKRLAEIGKQSLIETVISAGVPYLGTPEAIYGLLHGGHQSIVGGLFTNEEVARGLGRNMSSAYSLLPSAKYFEKAFFPTVAFASTTVPGANNGSYPAQLSSYEEEKAFITDESEDRTEPEFDDTTRPIKGNRILMEAAEALHGLIDAYSWPATIKHYSILGWNAITTRGLKYYLGKVCLFNISGLLCKDKVEQKIETTPYGDGTVVSTSAEDQDGQQLALDLDVVSHEEGRTIRHANILESSTTQSVIKMIVEGGEVETGDLPNGVSWTIPISAGTDRAYWILSTHSPVELHVYDEAGNHTGLKPIPTELAANDFVQAAYETGIPGSEFRMSKSADGFDTYVHVPDLAGKTYKVSMTGTDLGYATFNAGKTKGEEMLGETEFSMFPVTPFTVVEAVIQGELPQDIALDYDGNGAIDAHMPPNPDVLPQPGQSLDSIRTVLLSILGDSPRARGLLKRLEHISQMAEKGKSKQSQKQGNQLKKNIGHLKLKQLSTADREEVLDLIEQVIESAE